jgi:hypothetical protein
VNLAKQSTKAVWKWKKFFFGSLAVKWSVTHNVKKRKIGKKYLTAGKSMA